MNLLNCFEAYNIESISIKYNPSGFGISWLPVVKGEVLNDDAWENTNDAICEFIGEYQDGCYHADNPNQYVPGELAHTEFMCGVLTPDEDCSLVRFEGSQSRKLNLAYG